MKAKYIIAINGGGAFIGVCLFFTGILSLAYLRHGIPLVMIGGGIILGAWWGIMSHVIGASLDLKNISFISK